MADQLKLSGSLEELPLPDVVRLIQTTRKIGRLALTYGNSSGSIHFHQGDIIDCQSTHAKGLEALKSVALYNRGSFEFTDGLIPAEKTLADYDTEELIGFLENRMFESRQLQELMPEEIEIPRYLGGSIPAGLEVSAADLAIALKAAAGSMSVRRLASELSLDEITVRYTVARLRAAGLMEMNGVDTTEIAPVAKPPALPPPLAAAAPVAAPVPDEIPGAPNNTAASTKPRYWRGRRID